ncbi:MAG: GNAT family N-acetyltransferase [candidate division WOR-3 bacterium]|nr:MAG: GNAT family N-acetyltransferase [candidate division WOR-3 bacterium]
MIKLDITPYTLEDNEAALFLEEQCVQGKSLALKYRRPTFHARSEVYEKYRIICAKHDGKLVGISAWSEKNVTIHENPVRAAYAYDLRVLPAYRARGVALKIMKATLDDILMQTDFIYTLIAGQNQVAFKLVRHMFGMKTVIPLTYIIIPVFKRLKSGKEYCPADAHEIHEKFLSGKSGWEMVPGFDVRRLKGYVMSFVEKQQGQAGCSLWTNENILAEQVVAVPKNLQVLRIAYAPLRLFMPLPAIPKRGDILKSWFLFDLYAASKEYLYELLATVNNNALDNHVQYLYILLQNSDRLLDLISELGMRTFTLPYTFLCRPSGVLNESDNIYIDVRDI